MDKIQTTDCHIVTQSPALKGNQFTYDIVTFLGSLWFTVNWKKRKLVEEEIKRGKRNWNEKFCLQFNLTIYYFLSLSVQAYKPSVQQIFSSVTAGSTRTVCHESGLTADQLLRFSFSSYFWWRMAECGLNTLYQLLALVNPLTPIVERKSARMSNITKDGLTRSVTGCFIAVPIWQQWASKG